MIIKYYERERYYEERKGNETLFLLYRCRILFCTLIIIVIIVALQYKILGIKDNICNTYMIILISKKLVKKLYYTITLLILL